MNVKGTSTRLKALLDRQRQAASATAAKSGGRIPLRPTTSDIEDIATGLIPVRSQKIVLKSEDVADQDGEDSELRTLAFLSLSAFCARNDPSSASSSASTTADHELDVRSVYGSYLERSLADSDPIAILQALSLLSALLQLVPSQLSDWLRSEPDSGSKPIWDTLMEFAELPELFPTLEVASVMQLAVVDVLNLASGITALRPTVAEKAGGWLRAKATKEAASSLRKDAIKSQISVLASVALTKLSRASKADPQQAAGQDGSSTTGTGTDVGDLAGALGRLIVDNNNSDGGDDDDEADGVTSAVEGLAYATLEPAAKVQLGGDPAFMKSLFALCERTTRTRQKQPQTTGLSASYDLSDADLDASGSKARDNSLALAFGLSTVLVNLLSRKPQLSEEQQQVEKLKAMASGKMGKKAEQAKTAGLDGEDDNRVEKRITLALQCDVGSGLAALAKVESVRVREAVGKVLLELATDRTHRLALLQQGGAKTTTTIVRALAPSLESSEDALPAVQALAKLIINTPPINLFGADASSAALDSIRPLCVLLRHPMSNLLQVFEALMALTNLASIHPRVADRIVTTDESRVIQQIESEMLNENTLVRRAAVELVCNLVGCDRGFCRYSGDELEGTTPNKAASKTRLHTLLAMTDVTDAATRSAAAGALATLTQSPRACDLLLTLDPGPSKALGILKRMLEPPRVISADEDEDEDIEEISTLPPDPALVHRCVIILVNLFIFISTKSDQRSSLDAVHKTGIVQLLLGLLAIWTDKNSRQAPPDKDAVDATIECLRLLKEMGVKLTAY